MISFANYNTPECTLEGLYDDIIHFNNFWKKICFMEEKIGSG